VKANVVPIEERSMSSEGRTEGEKKKKRQHDWFLPECAVATKVLLGRVGLGGKRDHKIGVKSLRITGYSRPRLPAKD